MYQTTLLPLNSVDYAFEAAIELIKVYVLRGETIKQLSAGQMGHTSPGGLSASIGGYIEGKRYPTSKIVVSRDIKGEEVNKVFDLSKVYGHIKEGNYANDVEHVLPSEAKVL